MPGYAWLKRSSEAHKRGCGDSEMKPAHFGTNSEVGYAIVCLRQVDAPARDAKS